MPTKILATMILAAASILACSTMASGQGRQYPVRPGDDYRAILQRLQPGDELVFLPGIHERATSLKLQGTADQPITLRGQIDADGKRPIVQSHNNWDMLRNIDVWDNTAAGNGHYDFSFTGRLQNVRALRNIALVRTGSEGVRGVAEARAGNLALTASPDLLAKIDALVQSRLDPTRLAAAVEQLPKTPIDTKALETWLDKVPAVR